MPKKTAKKAAKPARSSRTSPAKAAGKSKASTNHALHGGVYVTPRGNVSLVVPAFWSFRQTNDDLELDSPTTHSSVVVTAFKRDPESTALDSREYMDRFLRTAPAQGRKSIDLSTKSRSIARFKDSESTAWQVEFLTDGRTLLLATLNTSEAPRSPEAKTGTAVLASIKLRRK